MRIWNTSASKRKVRDIQGLCSWCGSPVEWRETFEATRVPLIPTEFPTVRVPPRYRWHVDNGIAHLGAHPRDYGRCRIKHSSVCPAVEHEDLDPAMESLVNALAVQMRKKIDAGWVPAPVAPRSEAEVQEPDPATAMRSGERHIIAHGGSLRLTPGPLAELQCVALTQEGEDGERKRCPEPVFEPAEGRWARVSIPYAPGRAHQQVLNVTGGMMWVWELRLHDYEEIRRWLRQRCPRHTGDAVFEACDVELVSFDPLRHDDFILGQPPAGYDILPHPADGNVFGLAEPERTLCATEGCGNGTVVRGVEEGWRCFQCARTARRRDATRQRWQRPS